MVLIKMEKLQTLLFELSEYIPNGKYIEIMDEVLKVHNYIKFLKEHESDSDSSETGIDIPAFSNRAKNIICNYYETNYGYFIFTYDLIVELKDYGYTPKFIADNLNHLLYEHDCFYCPVYDDLIVDDLNENFIHYDYNTFFGISRPNHLEDTIKYWVQERFNNVLKNF